MIKTRLRVPGARQNRRSQYSRTHQSWFRLNTASRQTFFYGADVYSLQVGYRDIKTHADPNAFNGHEKSNVALFRRIPCE